MSLVCLDYFSYHHTESIKGPASLYVKICEIDDWTFPDWHVFTPEFLASFMPWRQGTMLATIRSLSTEYQDTLFGFVIFTITNESQLPAALRDLGIQEGGEIICLHTNPAFLRLGLASHLLNAIFTRFPR